MALNYAYFYTLTVLDFSHLLADDKLKRIIIESWQYLVQQKLIEIYGYVIMPNHVHLIWNISPPQGHPCEAWGPCA
jgi:putative transposase